MAQIVTQTIVSSFKLKTTIKLSQLSRCKRESHKTQITKNEAFDFNPCLLNFCQLSEPSQKSSPNRPGPASIQPAH
ncbi:unnamed protein product [Oikopleura dioica]|uniref:Uncharacterized protein n=1 Tax=Oikopleura dioica TaxID=34765 RepID=E4XNW5_OIKDI|nr:unnamed protein product [Oikopleura dioica]